MEKSAFSRNIKALREQQGLTQEQLADELGIVRQTTHMWETGKIGRPRQNAIVDLIKQKFNVTETDLFGNIDGLYAKINGLTSAPPGAIAPIASAPAFLPLRGRVHAGDPTDPETLDGMVELPESVAKNHPNAYFLEVEGDCMDKVYPEGCMILVDPDCEPSDGSIAAVAIDDADYVMRRLKRGAKSLMLSPESTNPEHEDILITDGDGQTVKLVGTVVWYQPKKELG